MNRRNLFSLGAATAALAAAGQTASAETAVADNVVLARSLPGGFTSGYAQVNGVRLHYVAGGQGDPLVLIPGWPQTWWEFRKIMPTLARKYRVIAVDLRGMGGSSKPQGGYDKKTMARDIYELIRKLGYSRAHIAGHDIGAMVAFSFAANHPAATRTVTLMDVAHPDESMFQIPLLPNPAPPVHVWWFAFNQLRGLPEQLLTGRFRSMVDWLMDNLLINKAGVSEYDRDLYAKAYDNPEAIRAGNAWYQAFYQDIEDRKGYGPVAAPMLGLGSEFNYDYLAYLLPTSGTDVRVDKIAGSGHFLAEEQPKAVTDAVTAFLSGR